VRRFQRFGGLAFVIAGMALGLVAPAWGQPAETAAAPIATTNEGAPPDAPPAVNGAADHAAPQGDTAASADAAGDTSEAPTNAGGAVDFFLEIQPILQMHCLECHGPEKRSGGLRLDTREFAEAGGDSGKSILTPALAENELYQRIASQDRSYRMPKNKDALPDDQIQLIKRWIESGPAWPATKASANEDPWYMRWLGYFYWINDNYKQEVHFARPFAIAFVLAQCLLLMIARCKGAFLAGKPWTQGRARHLCQLCARLTATELTLVWTLLLVSLVTICMFGHTRVVDKKLDVVEQMQRIQKSQWVHTVYGYPPVPIRPDQPPEITRTYYRGNCERNPQLFNGGNYLTAIFRVTVCDDEHQTLKIGDPFPKQGQLWIRVETERAPGTADALFSKELMEGVFLSQHFYESTLQPLRDEPVHLQTLSEGKLWVAFVPIGQPDDNQRLSGLIYMCTGRVEKGMIRGEPHYGVKFDIKIENGKLAEGSDVWMNSFGNGVFATPDPPGKLPYREWFDYRPLPVIVGENTKDPKLLGVEEYIRKGLISGGQIAPTPQDKKPAEPQAGTPDASPAPQQLKAPPGEEAPPGEAPSSTGEKPTDDAAPGAQGNE